MKGFRKGLSILLVFALVITSMVAFSAKTTEAKVKSIKVAKKVTVVEGKSKTVKVKVKTTKKTSKKFTAKSSNKKIATVKVKKKIQLSYPSLASSAMSLYLPLIILYPPFE